MPGKNEAAASKTAGEAAGSRRKGEAMTKMTFRFTTELDKDYINQIIAYMIADYEHGLLTGLEVDVSGDEGTGTYRIRRDRKRRGRRRIPKELEIPEFMRRPSIHAAPVTDDNAGKRTAQDIGREPAGT